MSTGRIALLTCYFGKLPTYAPLVFRSIAANPSIDWILITDQDPAFELPPNVILKKWTIEKLSMHFSEVLNLTIRINQPYELCNLRPSFGLVFADYLTDHDFWGHCDLDMIFGDLRAFLPEEIMAGHDRIYCRGHLSIYRNTPRVNGAFRLDTPGVPDYREVFQNPRFLTQYDEWPGIWKILRYHRFPQYHKDVIADIKPPNLHFITRFEAEEQENYARQVFYWHEGKVFQAYYHREGGLFDKELAYIHFQKRSFPTPDFDPEKTPGFLIGPGGFTPYDRENLFPEEMERLNGAVKRPWSEVLERRWLRLKRGLAKRMKKG